MARYKKIIVIGYGMIVSQVLEYLCTLCEKSECPICFIEHETNGFSNLEKKCAEKGIEFHQIHNKKELTSFFLSVEERTLILSVSNNYLFPKAVLSKGNIQVINFHNALLPAYPGRNAPSWVILNDEELTGITWHFVTEDIDAGKIISQRTVKIGPDTKAFELAYELMKVAYEAFVSFFPALVAGTIVGQSQGIKGERRIFKSSEIPGDGHFLITDDPKYIYRLLRALDYGKMPIFPNAQTTIDCEKVEVTRYRLIDKKDNRLFPLGENCIKIPFSDEKELMLKYQPVNE